MHCKHTLKKNKGGIKAYRPQGLCCTSCDLCSQGYLSGGSVTGWWALLPGRPGHRHRATSAMPAVFTPGMGIATGAGGLLGGLLVKHTAVGLLSAGPSSYTREACKGLCPGFPRDARGSPFSWPGSAHTGGPLYPQPGPPALELRDPNSCPRSVNLRLAARSRQALGTQSKRQRPQAPLRGGHPGPEENLQRSEQRGLRQWREFRRITAFFSPWDKHGQRHAAEALLKGRDRWTQSTAVSVKKAEGGDGSLALQGRPQ